MKKSDVRREMKKWRTNRPSPWPWWVWLIIVIVVTVLVIAQVRF